MTTKKRSLPLGLVIWAVFVLVPLLAGVLLLLFFNPEKDWTSKPKVTQSSVSQGSDEHSQLLPTSTPTVIAEPTAAPTTTTNPVLWEDYSVGELRKSYSTVVGCQAVVDSPFEAIYGQQMYCPLFSVHFGDKLEITGPAKLFNRAGQFPLEPAWYWPIRIVEGLGRFEGVNGWIEDGSAELVATTANEPRYRPDFQEGEVVVVGYPSYLPNDAGVYQWIRAGQKATVLAEPIPGNDGRYRCHVRTESGFIGWMYCELQKLD